MALKFVDRVQALSTTTGTGTYTLGSAVTGFQAFSALTNLDSCYYCACDVDGSGNPSGGWEVGLGTYTSSGTTLSRDRIDASSNSGAAVSWAAGTRRIMLTAPASLFTSLIPAEIAITGAVTLTSAAWGKSYVCSGTSTDYTIVLPTAVGHAGERISIRMADALTKLVTLDGNGSETLNLALTRIQWAGESCVLLSDGANLVTVGGVSKAMGARILRSTAMASPIADSTVTKIPLDVTVFDHGGLADLANNQLVIRRSGLWTIGGALNFDSIPATANVQTRVHKNGTAIVQTAIAYNSGPWYPATVAAVADLCVAGDTLDLRAYQVTSTTINIYPDVTNWLYATEVL